MMRYVSILVMALCLGGCQIGVSGHPLELPMEHGGAEKKAVKSLHIQKNPKYVLPTTKGVVHDGVYDQSLVIPEDLRKS